MKRFVVMLLAVTVLPGCAGSGGDESTTSALVPEAAAVLDAYFEAHNDQDSEAFLRTVHPGVYEYVFSGIVSSAEVVAGRMDLPDKNPTLERLEQIEAKVTATTEDSYYVAVTAERSDDEIGGTVNGIIVVKLTLYPEGGWLVTLHHNYGM